MRSGMLAWMSQQIAVRLPEQDLARVDAAVAQGAFASRAAAVRAGLDLLLKQQRDREIAEQYRRAYGAHPQEEWIGRAGLAATTALIAAEKADGTDPSG